MSFLSLTLASRYLRARKAEGFVSVIAGFSFLGIMLGVATLIIVMSVMNGFQSQLLQRLLGLNGHITIIGPQQGIRNFEPIASDIEHIAGVTKVTPMIERQGLLSAKGASVGIIVRAYRAQDVANTPLLVDKLTGSLKDFKDDGIWIGSAMAQRLNLKIGDQMALLSPQGRATPFGTVPKSMRVKIAGVFDVGMYEYNSGFVLMPLATAQGFYELPYSVSEISIQTKNPQTSFALTERIEPLLSQTPGVQVQDWRDTNQSYFNALQVERNVMFLILTLIILVAAFNVISGMIMMVKDKTRDIAILRTLGARNRQLRGALLAEFAALGLVAGALAGVGATGIGWALGHFVFKLPYAPSLLPVLAGSVAGCLVVMLAGWLGTRHLLSRPPLESLRALTYRACDLYVQGQDVLELASMAKLKAGRLNRLIPDACLQFWGGMGYTWDNHVSRAFRDGRLGSIGGGADEVMLGIICKLMGIATTRK